MKKKEFEKEKEKSLKELKTTVLDLKRKYALVSAKISAGREKNLKAGKALRIEIAKLMSLIGQKEREINKQA